MADGHLFTNFVKEHRPLSFLLERVFAGPLLDRIRQSSLGELDGEIDALMNELVARVRVDPPVLGATRPVRVTDGIARPAREAGATQPTSRFHSAIQVRGHAELLRAWPDQSGMDLPAVDEERGDPFAGRRRDGPWDYETELRMYEYLVARELWFLTAVEGSDELVLCTFVELTVEDEQRVRAGDLSPRRQIEAQRAVVQPVVDAIGRDVTFFFEHALPRMLKGAIEVRRSRLEARRAVEENLTWGPEWKAATPKLVSVEPEEEEDAPLGLPTVSRRRLDPAAFTDVVTSIRLWADSMERHPRVWSRLEEEDISDLLVATLNAALPGAQREVYSRSGKSDIFITADVLAAGAGPAKVFICENKIWDGPVKAGAALDQLLGYLEVKDTAAVLLFFRKTGRGPAVRKALQEALTARDDHVGSGADLGGWPVEKFRNGDGAVVDVCLAVVDLPKA